MSFGPHLRLYSPLRLAGRTSPWLGLQAMGWQFGVIMGHIDGRAAMDIRIHTELRIGVHYLGGSTGPRAASLRVWRAEATYHTLLKWFASSLPSLLLDWDWRLHCLRLLHVLRSIDISLFRCRVLCPISLRFIVYCTFLLQKDQGSIRHWTKVVESSYYLHVPLISISTCWFKLKVK